MIKTPNDTAENRAHQKYDVRNEGRRLDFDYPHCTWVSQGSIVKPFYDKTVTYE